jgi:oligopeptidase B
MLSAWRKTLILRSIMPHQAADRKTSGITEASSNERKAADERAFECSDWLRERESLRVRSYVDEENANTKRSLAHLAALRQLLYKEIVDRVDLNRGTMPVRHGGFEYYSRHEEDRSYPIHCRRRLDSAVEQVILDENGLADGKPYFVLECLSVSPDHRRCIFGIDTSGDERLSLYLKECGGDESTMAPIGGAAAGVAWANDGQTFFSVRLDERNRPFQVIRHQIAEGSISESVAFEERAEAFRLQIARTESGRFLVVTSWAHDTTELRYLSADEPTLPIRMLHPRQAGIEAYATHHGEHFYLITKEGGRGEKIIAVSIGEPMGSKVHTFLEAGPGVEISYMQAFAAHIVVCERRDGLCQLRVINMHDGVDHLIALPGALYSLYPEDNREFETDTVRFGYDSLTTPYTVYDYNMTDRQLQVRQRSSVRGYDGELYRSERILVSTADDVEVPLSLVYRKGLKRDGSHPALLYGYGAYGYCIEPQFSSLRLSLLDRGFVYAIAHVRGGGELGREWHEQGKGRLKHNSFGDFIACAEHLVQHGYTSPVRLAVMGESAGGLLAAAVINERPDLFAAVVVDGPFVDVVNTLLDPTLPFTISEWKEWGNPAEPADRSYLSSYSPYENVKQHDYPPILMLCSFSDPRVPYWEGIKWARRIRAASTSDREVLINVRFDGGHQGVSDRFAQVDEWALIYAFIVGCVAETSNPGELGQCPG